MSVLLWIVLSLCVTFICACIIAVTSQSGKTPRTFCYFASHSVEIETLELGKGGCQGRAEMVYVTAPGMSSAVLSGSKVCSAHAIAMTDLGRAVEKHPEGFWRVPKL